MLISFATKRRPVDGGCLLLNGADIVDVLASRVGRRIFKADLATGFTLGTRKDPPRVFDEFAHLIFRVELFSYADHFNALDFSTRFSGVIAFSKT